MTKKIFILLILAFLLGLIVILVEKPFNHRFDTSENTPFYPELKIENVAAIEIEYLVNGTRFEKDDKGNWVVMLKKTDLQNQIEEQEKSEKEKKSVKKDQAGDSGLAKLPADSEKVREILEVFADLKRGMPVSSDPAKQPLLEITNISLNVTLFDVAGKKQARLFVGKQGPDIFSTFVRDENENTIYLVDKHLPGIFNRPIEEWVKREEKSPQPPNDKEGQGGI